MSYVEFDEILRGLLLNFSLILIPLFLFESFVLSKKSFSSDKIDKVEIALISSVSILLCMTFPIPLFDGHLFDLRLIPILIVVFYGGTKPATFTLMVMIIYRIYLGGDGLFTMILAYTIIIALSFYVSPKYKYFSKNRKLVLASYITIIALGLIIFSTYIINKNKPDFSFWFFVYFFMFYGVFKLLSINLTINLIEGFIEKRELRTEIQRSDRLNTVGELAASLAHEIRNPLTVAKGFIQLIQMNKDLEGKRFNEYIEVAMDEMDRAEGVISDFLAFAKPNIEKQEVVNVANTVESVSKMISSYAIMQNILIIHQLDPGCYLFTDKAKLTQVLINIMKNGIEAMPTGGTLISKVYRAKDKVIIEITDTGVGMTKDEVSRLGTPFYSLKYKGTGLGLMISYKFIEVMGGKISVHSEKGKGTTFTLEFTN